MIKKVFWILILSCISYCYGQKSNQTYQLLWKIEGKNLSEPSYLFGTMHSKDQRVFDFPDSVLIALNSCQAFASEIDPYDMYQMQYKRYEYKDTINTPEQIYTDEEYDFIKEQLEKETGLKIEKLRKKNIKHIERLILESRKSKNGINALILDSYLYDLARQHGKNTHGVENYEEHMKIYKEILLKDEKYELIRNIAEDKQNIPESLKMKPEFLRYEYMIEVYQEGDIKKIDSIYSEQIKENGDLIKLIERNFIMAESIDSLIQLESTFIAVGAAHLAGDSGVIQLLKEKGYLLSVVDDYKSNFGKQNKAMLEATGGFLLTNINEGYEVHLPGHPEAMKLPNTNKYMYIYTDMTSNTSAFVVCNKKGNLSTDMNELYENAIENMLARMKGKLIKKNRCTVDGSEGIEILVEGQYKSFIKVRLIEHNATIYIIALGMTKEIINSEASKKYFNSFRFLDIETHKTEFETIHETEGGFKVSLPVGYTNITLKDTETIFEENPILIHIFSGVDTENDASYILRYHDLSRGYFCEEDSVLLDETIEIFKEAYNDTTKGEITYKKWGHYNSAKYSFEKNGYHIDLLSIQRGNRNYVLIESKRIDSLISILDSLNSSFFNSFELAPYKEKGEYLYHSPNHHFSVVLPENPEIDASSGGYFANEDSIINFYSKDNFSGLSYIITECKFSKYYQVNEMDSFFYTEKTALSEAVDSILLDTIWQDTNGVYINDFIFKNKNANSSRRVKYFQSGFRQYILDLTLPAELESNFNIPFFNSFVIHEEGFDSTKLSQPKGQILLRDLMSKDTLLVEEAQNYISMCKFNHSDVAALQEAIDQFVPIETDDYSDTKALLINQLKKYNDSTSIDFIKTQVRKDQVSIFHRAKLISVLSHIHNEQSMNEYFKQIEMLPTADSNTYYGLFDGLQDSVLILINHFEEVYKACNSANKMAQFIRTLNSILEEDTLNSYIKPFERHKELFQLTYWKYNGYESKSYNYTLQNFTAQLINILMKFDNQEGNKEIFQAALKDKNEYTRFKAVCGLLLMGIEVPDKELKEFAHYKSWNCIDFFKFIVENELEELIAKHLSQEKVSQANIYSYLIEDDWPLKIKFYKTIEVMFDSTKQIIYIYKYKSNYDNSWYYAYSGPQPVNSNFVYPSWYDAGALYDYISFYKSDKELEKAVIKDFFEYNPIEYYKKVINKKIAIQN